MARRQGVDGLGPVGMQNNRQAARLQTNALRESASCPSAPRAWGGRRGRWCSLGRVVAACSLARRAGPPLPAELPRDRDSGLSFSGLPAPSSRPSCASRVGTLGPHQGIIRNNFAGVCSTGNPPDAQLAVGQNVVMEATNFSLQSFRKTGGAPTMNKSFMDWFASQGPAGYFLFDPQLIIDANAKRFVFMVTGTIRSGTPMVDTKLFLSESTKPDGTGAWIFLTIDENINNDHTVFHQDGDHSKLGSSAGYLYLTSNMLRRDGPGGGTSAMWIVNNTQLSSGTRPRVARTSPLLNQDGTQAVTVYPANQLDSTSVGYAVDTGSMTGGTTDYVTLFRVTCQNCGSLRVSRTTIGVGRFGNPTGGIPQPGTSIKLKAGDARMRSAVSYKNHLYATAQTSRPDGSTPAAARVFNIDLTGNSEFGFYVVGTGVSTFYPAVAVTSNGALFVATEVSGAQVYPRLDVLQDQPSNQGTGLTLKAGERSYTSDTGDDPDNAPWGDYIGISPDTYSGTSVWVAGEYGSNLTDSDGANKDYATWIGNVGS